MLKGINPGRLKQRVTIARYQETEDAQGNTIDTLVPYKKAWAEIRPERKYGNGEILEYYKTMDSGLYKITMRHTDVTEKDVILFRGKQFRIMTISNPLMDNYYLELFCVEYKDHEVREDKADGDRDDDGGSRGAKI